MFLTCVVYCILVTHTLSISQHPILIVVSYDAYRHDFLDCRVVPNICRLREKGTYADYMINVFPTKTYPNHHSIATGLYPEVHGVIGNTYYDPNAMKIVSMSEEMFNFNENVVPIWRRNEDLGDGRHSGVMMWPGSFFPYQNKTVTYRQKWILDYDWNKRVDTVISWILDPIKPANLILLYFEEPDYHLHAFGPESKELQNILSKLDNITQYLEHQLEFNNLSDKVNVIHLSDHGILGVKPTNFINITQYLVPNSYIFAGTTPILQFTPNKGFEEDVYKRLKLASQENGHFQVYKKADYLTRWHYKNNARSPPILVMADPYYGLDDLISAASTYADKYKFKITNDSLFGVHGYDYTEETMRPFFMARGPKIKESHIVKPFHSIDLFNLFCEILEITPTKNNGSLDNVKDVLKDKSGAKLSSAILLSIGAFLIILILIGTTVPLILIKVRRRQANMTVIDFHKRFTHEVQDAIEAQHLLEAVES